MYYGITDNLKNSFNQQCTVSRIWKKVLIYFPIKRYNVDFIDNMEKRTCSMKSFKFRFYFIFFSTLHQRTLKCYKDVSESTWKKNKKGEKKRNKIKKTTSISTDGGCRLVPRLKQETYCHGKKKPKKNKIAHGRQKRQRTFAKL